MSRKTSHEWFAEYAVCHQNRTNKVIHWICVPAIAASLVGMLWSIPVPWAESLPWLNWAIVVTLASLVFYVRMSLPHAVGMAVWSAAVIAIIVGYESLIDLPVWIPCVGIFVVAWVGQFIGHKIEGKKPAFFQDLQFLLIGPAWVLNALYERVGIRA